MDKLTINEEERVEQLMMDIDEFEKSLKEEDKFILEKHDKKELDEQMENLMNDIKEKYNL